KHARYVKRVGLRIGKLPYPNPLRYGKGWFEGFGLKRSPEKSGGRFFLASPGRTCRTSWCECPLQRRGKQRADEYYYSTYYLLCLTEFRDHPFNNITALMQLLFRNNKRRRKADDVSVGWFCEQSVLH